MELEKSRKTLEKVEKHLRVEISISEESTVEISLTIVGGSLTNLYNNWSRLGHQSDIMNL